MQEPPQPTKSAKAKLGQPTIKPQDSVSSPSSCAAGSLQRHACSRVSSAESMHLQAGPLLKLQCPCLFAHGDRDALCPVEGLSQTQQEMAQPCENLVIQVPFLSCQIKAASISPICCEGAQGVDGLPGPLHCWGDNHAHA